MEPRWKQFVDDLRAKHHESPYLERLQERVGPTFGHQSIELEIVQEMASALGRAEDKVNVALLKLEVVAKKLAEAESLRPRPPEWGEWIAEFNARREEALKAREELVIHREALGMYNNSMLPSLYPIPPKRTD